MKLPSALRLIAAFVLMFLLPAFPVMADNRIGYTGGEIDFIAGAGPVDPLDPDAPEHGLLNLNGVAITDDSDSLSLNVAPDFLFAQSNGEAFPAKLVGEQTYALYSPQRPYIQVSDLRGTGGGWKLSVNAEPFLRGEAPALNGAKIRLYGGTALSSNPTLSPPGVNDPIVIECTDQTAAPVTVVDALGDPNSMGAWIFRWYPLDSQGNFTTTTPAHLAGVDLYVPSGTLVLPGSYSTTLYWTLSDVA